MIRLFSLVLALAMVAAPLKAQDAPVIAVAANAAGVTEEIAGAFTAETKRGLRITSGASGNIVRQIRQGAPFQLFLSADEDFVFQLAQEGRTLDRGALYAVGRLALFAPHNGPLASPDLQALRDSVAQGRIRRFAIANPETAPYGRAAIETLQAAGLLEQMRSLLVYGENVAQAMQFASSGNADAGLVPWSLAIAPAVAPRGRATLIPAGLHAPLPQRMVLLNTAGETARLFYAHLQSEASRTIFRRHGFLLPGEE